MLKSFPKVGTGMQQVADLSDPPGIGRLQDVSAVPRATVDVVDDEDVGFRHIGHHRRCSPRRRGRHRVHVLM